MAWYAELRRRRWYCINGFDMVLWYKRYLYDIWWSSLTEVEKCAVIERRKRDEKRKERRLKEFIAMSNAINSIYSNKSIGEFYRY